MVGFWIALACFVVALAAGSAVVAVRGLEAWRQLKRTRAAFGAELERISRATEDIQRQLAAASASQESLRLSLERLTASRERLMVQLAAVGEAQWLVRRLLPFLPR